MAKFRIITPVLGFTGISAGVNFTSGVAEVDVPDDPQHALARAVAYFRAQGYGVEPLDEPEPEPVSRARKTTTQKGADQ